LRWGCKGVLNFHYHQIFFEDFILAVILAMIFLNTIAQDFSAGYLSSKNREFLYLGRAFVSVAFYQSGTQK